MKFEEGRWGTWLFPIIPGIISTMKFIEIHKVPKKGGGLYLQSRHSVPRTGYSNSNSHRLILQDKDKRLSPSFGQARLPMKYEKNSYRSISWMSDRV
ncbi:hypothetical protein [Paenibacillus sp. 32O-W]|uniref:hypothetical protein n=1 Tax=Paenibacillus sp. 32O-W TaxID=1695218 RepID=UPI0011A174BA|nr:hypothetical protein [Paenibacillus sp. 32O-W]